MELRVNDYVRTDDGLIGKIVSEPYEYKDSIGCDIDFGDNNIYNEYEMYQNIIKSSPNIIDLIEVGDYVNGSKVYQVGYNFLDNLVLKMSIDKNGNPDNYEDFIHEYEIKSIVTREEFESMEYKIGSE